MKKKELPPFTEKALKESKSLSKGDELEKILSYQIHHFGTPVLISPNTLRSHHCGQVDIVHLYKSKIKVFEIKSHPEMISVTQLRRLKKSVNFIHLVLDTDCHFQVINKLPKDLSFFNLNT